MSNVIGETTKRFNAHVLKPFIIDVAKNVTDAKSWVIPFTVEEISKTEVVFWTAPVVTV